MHVQQNTSLTGLPTFLKNLGYFRPTIERTIKLKVLLTKLQLIYILSWWRRRVKSHPPNGNWRLFVDKRPSSDGNNWEKAPYNISQRERQYINEFIDAQHASTSRNYFVISFLLKSSDVQTLIPLELLCVFFITQVERIKVNSSKFYSSVSPCSNDDVTWYTFKNVRPIYCWQGPQTTLTCTWPSTRAQPRSPCT